MVLRAAHSHRGRFRKNHVAFIAESSMKELSLPPVWGGALFWFHKTGKEMEGGFWRLTQSGV